MEFAYSGCQVGNDAQMNTLRRSGLEKSFTVVTLFSIVLLFNCRTSFVTDHTVQESVLTQWDGDEIHPRLSPDGTRLVVASNKTGFYSLYLLELENSKELKITEDGTIALEPCWSPDGNQIGYRSTRGGKWGLWIYSLKSQQSNLVFRNDSIMPIAPDWSPDGKQMVFTGIKSGEAHLYSLDLETSVLQRLTDGGDEYYPKWNINGNQLVYYIGKSDSIMILDMESKQTICVNKGKYNGWRPVFSPSGEELAFISEKGGHWDLWTTSVTTPFPVQITNSGFDDFPHWSPDGGSIVISRLMTVNQLFELDAESLSIHQLTNSEFDQIDYQISNDVKRVVFGRISLGDELWIEDLVTNSNKQLTKDFGDRVKSPCWSPSGDSVVFVNQTFFPGGSQTDLYVVEVKSSLTYRVTKSGSALNPLWAKDGNIYFSQKDSAGFYQINAFDPLKNTMQQITSGLTNRIVTDLQIETGMILYENTNGLFSMSILGGNPDKIAKGKSGVLSPDGTRVAFVSNDNAQRWDDIYVTDLLTRESRRLSNDRFSENTLAWREDGKSIFFNGNRGDKDIWIIKLR